VLSLSTSPAGTGPGPGLAGCPAADRAGVPQLRLAADDGGAPAAGLAVNHKRVYRLMREDNLLCLRRRKFVLTTDSDHGLPVYPNLASTLVLTGLDQLWVADLTYIRLELEFIYLAVLLDAFSRREIGWALDRTLEASLAIDALQMALRRRRPAPGLVHHSDQGCSTPRPTTPLC